jgi:hypothetical protein
MSGAMRKIGEYLGLLEDTGRYDEYDGDRDLDARRGRASARSRGARPPRVRPGRAPAPAAVRPESWPSLSRDHHPAPAHLQRGAHRRRELPRRHAR